MSKRSISLSSDDSDDSSGNSKYDDSKVDFLCAVRTNDYEQVANILGKVNSINAHNLVNSKDFNAGNDSPLHIAVKVFIKNKRNGNLPNLQRSKDIINLLIQNRASVNYRNAKHKTAFDLVSKNLSKYHEIQNLLSDGSIGSSSRNDLLNQSSAVSDFVKNNSEKQKRTQRPLEAYATSGLKFSLHGTIFQLQLLMLYAHRALAKFPIFDLATEMDKAEKFDDIVIRYKADSADHWHWSFLQAKHKNTPQVDQITLKDLILSKDGIFSLTKYFLSFCKIVAKPSFKDGHLEEFILCTNTTLNLTKSKRKQNETVTDIQQNKSICQWENHLVCSALSDQSILFCPNSNLQTQVYRFNDNSYDDVSALVKSTFMEIGKSSMLISGFRHITKTLTVLEQQKLLSDVLKCIKRFEYNTKNEIRRKDNIKSNALNILKYKDQLSQFDFQALHTSLVELNSHKGRHYDTIKDSMKSAVNNLKKELRDAFDKCNFFIESLKDNSSPECVDINGEVQQLLRFIKILTDLRSDILKCNKPEDMKDELKKGIENMHTFGIPVNPNLSKIAKFVSDMEIDKTKIQNILETLIVEIVMIEIICSPLKFESLLKEFLEKFQLIVNYPDVTQLNMLLKTEFGEQFCLLDANLLTDSFERRILEWFMEYNNGRSTFFSNDQGHFFFQSLRLNLISLMTSGLNKAYLDKLQSYNIRFREPNDLFNECIRLDQRIMIISSDSTRLSTMKLLQELKKIENFLYEDSFICVRLKSLFGTEIRKLVCDAFSIENKFTCIIVECQNGSLNDIGFRYACEGLLTSLKGKKIIFITPINEFVFNELSALTSIEIARFIDKTKFDHLTETSQKALLTNTLLLQNELVTLDELIDIQSARVLIDEVNLQYLVERKSIEIGDTKAFFSNGYDSEYYINRCLHQQPLTTEIFKVANSVFLVTGYSEEPFSTLGVHNKLSIWEQGNKYPSGIIVFPTSAAMDGQFIFDDLVRYKSSTSEIIWVHYHDKTFYWQAFTGNYEKINDCIDKDCYFPMQNEDRFAIINFKQRVVVVANDPGVGKSTFITSLSRQIKKLNKSLWIVRINLNDHAFQRQWLSDIDNRRFTKSLSELPDVIDSDFICDMALWPNQGHALETFQRRLFKLGIDGCENALTPKILICFDGFDEVCPTYEEHVIKILQMLKKSAVVQIWITTRIQQKECLEIKFCPAHVLSNLTRDDQTCYLNKYWRRRVVSNVQDLVKLQEFDNVLQYLQELACNVLKHVEDNNGIFDRIKQGKYESFTSKYLESLENVDFQSFAIFLVNQWNNAIRDSQKDFMGIPLQLNMLGEIVVDQNFKLPEKIGLSNLFETFVQNKLNIYFYGKSVFVSSVLSDEVSKDQSKLLRQDHSILALNVLFPDRNWPRADRAPRLLARTGLVILLSASRFDFIHRSFAEFFVADLIVKKLKTEEMQSFLLKTIFNNDQYFLITTFLNEMLIQYPNHDVELSQRLLEDIEASSSNQDTFLHNIVYMGYPNITNFFIEKLYNYPDVFEKLLLKSGTYGSIPLYTIIYSPGQWQRKMNYSGSSKIQKIETFLSTLNDDHFKKVLTHFYEEMLILLRGKIRYVTMLQVAVVNSNFEIVEVFIKHIANRGLVKDVFMNNGFDRDGNIFHFCCRLLRGSMMNLLQLLTNVYLPEKHLKELKEMFLFKDSLGRTCLHWLAFHSQGETTMFQFLEWLEKYMPDIILEYLKCVDKQNVTPVEMAVYRCNTNAIEIFLDLIKQSPPETCEEILNGEFHNSLLNKSICQGKHESVKFLMCWYKRHSLDFKKQLLFSASVSDCRTSLTLAAARGFDETVRTVFSLLEEHLPKDHFNACIVKLMQHSNTDGRNILHESAFWDRRRVVAVLADLIYTKCNLETQIGVLFTADKWDNIPFDFSASKGLQQELVNIYEIVIIQIQSDLEVVSPISSYFTMSILNSIEKFVIAHYSDRLRLLEILRKTKCDLPSSSSLIVPRESVKPLLGLPS